MSIKEDELAHSQTWASQQIFAMFLPYKICQRHTWQYMAHEEKKSPSDRWWIEFWLLGNHLNEQQSRSSTSCSTTKPDLERNLQAEEEDGKPGEYGLQFVCHVWHVQLALNKLGVNSIIIKAISSVILSW